jgi:hypothetical protein
VSAYTVVCEVFLNHPPVLFNEAVRYLVQEGTQHADTPQFPLIFGPGNGGHGWTHSGTVNLTFLALVVGSVLACSFTVFQERYYQRALAAAGGKSVPEARMACALVGTWLLPAGLLIAAWTSYPELPWIAPLVGAAVFGFGFYQILYSILNYVVDGYGHYSASALAGVVLVRNLFGAGFPLFACVPRWLCGRAGTDGRAASRCTSRSGTSGRRAYWRCLACSW